MHSRISSSGRVMFGIVVIQTQFKILKKKTDEISLWNANFMQKIKF